MWLRQNRQLRSHRQGFEPWASVLEGFSERGEKRVCTNINCYGSSVKPSCADQRVQFDCLIGLSVLFHVSQRLSHWSIFICCLFDMFSLFLEFHSLDTLCVFRICMSSVASSSYDYIAYSAMSFSREGSFFAVDQKEDERPYVHRLVASVQTRRVIWHKSFHWDLLSRCTSYFISRYHIYHEVVCVKTGTELLQKGKMTFLDKTTAFIFHR